MTTTHNANPSNTTAEIALYGTRSVGFGYLATTLRVKGETKASSFVGGDGEPKASRSLTDCLFIAKDDLRAAGIHDWDTVAIYAPGGERVAYLRLGDVRPFGSIPADAWQAAPVYTIPFEAIEEAAGCPHESETTADGHGAFCRFCGEGLA